MSLALVFGLALGAAPAGAAPQDEQTIIVTGHRLDETERYLAECLARHCPPEEDIDAALAHAENLFVAGRYDQARATTRAALKRNARFARHYPVPVSDLYRADGRIAAHLGDRNGYLNSTWGIERALKTGFDERDPRRIGAAVEVADMYAEIGKADLAEQLYDAAASHAAAAGRQDLVGYVRVRIAWLAYVGGHHDAARHELERIAADRRPDRAFARLSALALLARLDRKAGRTASSDALVEEFRKTALPRPVLLFAPSLDLEYEVPPKERGSLPMWVDIGFGITPDGQVQDVEILRSHGRTDWTRKLIKSISGRLYSGSGGGGTYRIERYTFTQMRYFDTRSWNVQWGPPQIEFLDLTAEAAPASAAPS